jgi:hypothetical protein
MGILTPAKTSNMKDEKIYSPIEDTKIREDLNGSQMWKTTYHESDLELAKSKHPVLFEYIVRFDGLKPVFVTKVSRLA